MTPPAGPRLSVIIASVSGTDTITPCLEALFRELSGVPHEVVVADRCGGSLPGLLEERFPGIVVIRAGPTVSVPALRTMAIARSSGDPVAILGDGVSVVPGWLEAVRDACGRSRGLAGGCIDKDHGSTLVEEAAYFCEYWRFLPPLESAGATEVAGVNCVYDRPTLAGVRDLLDRGLPDPFLHSLLREKGVSFLAVPGLRVVHHKRTGWLEFARMRYHYSRSFAGMRLREAPGWKRIVYATATAGLPGLLLGRMLDRVRCRPGYRLRFARALPVLASFLVIWAWGEAVGALLGPGWSLEAAE